jgi:hypothetical protein
MVVTGQAGRRGRVFLGVDRDCPQVTGGDASLVFCGRDVRWNGTWLASSDGWNLALTVLRSLSRLPLSSQAVMELFGPASPQYTSAMKRLGHLAPGEASDGYLSRVVAALAESARRDVEGEAKNQSPPPGDELSRSLRERARSLEGLTFWLAPQDTEDIFAPLFDAVRAPEARKGRGEHYTPRWVVDLALDSLGVEGRCLDVACGTGAFLVGLISRTRGALPPWGVERDLVAAQAARLNCALALSRPGVWREAHIVPGDFLQGAGGIPRDFRFVVGNPPWINWERLPDSSRAAMGQLFRDHGLYTLKGFRTILGGAKKDLAMLFWQKAAGEFLETGGKISFVVTQSLLQSKGAGEGFRSFRLPSGEPLGILRVDDLVHTAAFGSSTIRPAVVQAQKGEVTRYPVPYVVWRLKGGRIPRDAPLRDARAMLDSEEMEALPVDASHNLSPWMVRSPRMREACAAILGRSAYSAREGCNTLGANGIYWLRLIRREGDRCLVENMPGAGRKPLARHRCWIEPDLIYPLVRGRDVGRWRARASGHILLAQDPRARMGMDEGYLRSKLPLTYRFLETFRAELEARRGYRRFFPGKGPFYSMYNVGEYTVAPYKVVWPYVTGGFGAAVLGPHDDPLVGYRSCVPDCKVVMVMASEEEAHYLSAVLNSSPARFLVSSYTVSTQVSVHLLEHLAVPAFDRSCNVHRDLAGFSMECHSGPSGGSSQERLDELAGALWCLDSESLAACRQASGPGRREG